MIKGIDIFKEYFKEYSNQYVIIGGVACDIIFDEYGGDFRATKDLDMVLIIEALTPEFVNTFWQFIRDGQYQNRLKSNGNPQYYRFDKPGNVSFPFMIELFSRSNFIPESPEFMCTPIHIDDEISSLSAILLDNDYYELLYDGRKIISDVVILTIEYLILFKAKAWLDLSDKIKLNPEIGQKNIKKHKNDILRLSTLLTGNERVNMSQNIRSDIEKFILSLENDHINLNNLGIKILTLQDLIDQLKKVYS